MRIAITSSRRTWGGIASVVAQLAPELARAGHEVTVFCRAGSQLHHALRGVVALEPTLRGPAFPPPSIVHSARRMHRLGIEVVLCGAPKDLRIVVPAARLLRLPVVACRVSLEPLRQRGLEGWAERRVTRFVANSRATRSAVLASAAWLDEERVDVVYNGIDVEAFARAQPAPLGLPTGAVAIGYVGRLDPEKGVEDLAEAWRALSPRLPHGHLLIVGQGKLESKLRSALAGDARVHWLGFRDDVPSVMRALDILVAPSRQEAFGLSAAEALAAGTPVIATRVGGLPEVVADGETGVLVQAGDSAGLARAILELANDPDRRGRMAAAGRLRAAEHFGTSEMAHGYEAALRRALRQNNSRGDRELADSHG